MVIKILHPFLNKKAYKYCKALLQQKLQQVQGLSWNTIKLPKGWKEGSSKHLQDAVYSFTQNSSIWGLHKNLY